ncbi:ubiquitin-conjugating enzyme E2 Z [Rhipicephalus sanguineus]|uniref:Ubiquitin-conjugating enzyme E2 Z n=1 Tax=Rhipicephalus sanguineus TaxID=34632 RepID=A0A9D4SYL7_RHISA|nr:ubiquitin-conjugating enzyme E2 Z [Rhipicephalus sanguineus]KAH7956993.1 hypothetical protein HPB52_014156 [Rhipicephalus sanguineus]
MATPQEQAPDAMPSTSAATDETDDETDNELLNSYVDVSSDYDSDDETDKSSLAAMKFAMSAAASGTKSAGNAIDAHFSALKVNPSLESLASKMNHWEPTLCEYEETTPQCRLRAKRDIMDLLSDPPPGVYIAPAEHNITLIDALVLGPADTPYEGGFFHFLLQCPPDYPIKPPRVRLMNTGSGRVRFNPNLYECGKVCLSILGTWTGPAWSPAQCISSVLISIQSLLSENPYYNEPGFENERRPGDSKQYNLIVQHETIRVAVCDAIEACLNGSSLCPPPLREVMLNTFPDYYEKYEKAVVSNVDLTGRVMEDPFGTRRGHFQYKTLLERLRTLRGQVQEWLEATRERSE